MRVKGRDVVMQGKISTNRIALGRGAAFYFGTPAKL
jgi:hypothetical protein